MDFSRKGKLVFDFGKASGWGFSLVKKPLFAKIQLLTQKSSNDIRKFTENGLYLQTAIKFYVEKHGNSVDNTKLGPQDIADGFMKSNCRHTVLHEWIHKYPSVNSSVATGNHQSRFFFARKKHQPQNRPLATVMVN